MDRQVFYSIIIVCLNAGNKLINTVESVFAQEYGWYEVIVKDGGSDDGSVETLEKKYYNEPKLKLCRKNDIGIYDAMNQAIELADGDYFLFLNAGDSLYDSSVLGKVTCFILDDKAKNKKLPDIIYGNMYHKTLDTVIYPAPQINDFTCYRNVPCHQTCFYNRVMFDERGYRQEYNVRADYEHFLWCYYQGGAATEYVPVTVAFYEGGGFSETKENAAKSKREHREITGRYMPADKVRKYRFIMLLTLAPLRTWLAGNPVTAGIYQTIKRKLYH